MKKFWIFTFLVFIVIFGYYLNIFGFNCSVRPPEPSHGPTNEWKFVSSNSEILMLSVCIVGIVFALLAIKPEGMSGSLTYWSINIMTIYYERRLFNRISMKRILSRIKLTGGDIVMLILGISALHFYVTLIGFWAHSIMHLALLHTFEYFTYYLVFVVCCLFFVLINSEWQLTAGLQTDSDAKNITVDINQL